MANSVDFPMFRELLQALENTDALIRVRMSGEDWIPFAKLILLSDNAMILQDGADNKMIMNLRSVVEFELETPAPGLSAHTVYGVGY